MVVDVIVFAKTRHHYDSYIDFWNLVTLSGFSWCYVDEIDLSKEVFYVVTPINGEVFPHLRSQSDKERKARLAWWCLERFDAMERPIAEVVEEASEFFDVVWTSDRWLSTLHPKLQFVVFGSHPDFGTLPTPPPNYHFTHQSYAWGRRADLYARLKKMGLKEGPSAWGVERDAVLRKSRFLLNLQQYQDPVTAPIRFAMGAAYHLPIISETIRDPYPLEGLLSTTHYADIPRLMKLVLEVPQGEFAEQIHQRLCHEWTFKKGVEAAV